MSEITLFESSISKINDSLAAQCPKMASLIEIHEIKSLTPKPNHFESLIEAILSQQLSTKAANTITRRFKEMIDYKLEPAELLLVDVESMRSCGISGQKSKYILDLAFHFDAYPLEYAALEKFDNATVIERLVRIKGIGVWSAQMFLMFSLGRPDVFPADDLGIKNAISILYNEGQSLKKQELEDFSMRWAPNRTMASYYLWRSLDKK